MSAVSGHQYGVGLLTVLVAASVGIGYYQIMEIEILLGKKEPDRY